MTIRFDGDRHAQLVDALRDTTASIERHLDDLDAAVAAGRAEWTGDARNAYDTAQRQWSDALDRMNASLADATSGMDAARSAFEAAEALVTRLWT
ncbi:WXG100 family type VII secretion target [Microbacterium sp. 20-116]|uniref:WXG100 family type VII secretion target n=1 Tax=unclassified Microbacterium TaxID=2609290 RepID=UPI001AE63EBD|nr:WXG100 family type VII secretion target [Microbacterium sp. SL75]WAC70414.1 WXG100 family type VII secretion target [Microbacterium sp. SL75]